MKAGVATLLGSGALLLNVAEAAAGGTYLKKELYPAKRNAELDPKWMLSDEKSATHYINFFEFTTTKTGVVKPVDRFTTTPWPMEIGGMVENPLKLDAGDLISMSPLEERVYRFRCVEAWAMIVRGPVFNLASWLRR